MAQALAGLVQFSVVHSHRPSVQSGDYLMHIGDGAGGEANHCVAVALRDGAAFHVLPSENGGPFLAHPPPGTEWQGPLIELIDQGAAAPSDLGHPLMCAAAGVGKRGVCFSGEGAPSGLIASVTEELEQWASRLETIRGKDPAFGDGDGWACPMCPLKVLGSKRRLADHFAALHTIDTGAVPSTKQQRVIAALWNHDQSNAQAAAFFNAPPPAPPMPMYIKRSADVLNEFMRRSPSWPDFAASASRVSAHLDEHIVLLLDFEDTRYILKADAGLYHRVSFTYYCTDRFLAGVFASIVHPTTKGAAMRRRIVVKYT